MGDPEGIPEDIREPIPEPTPGLFPRYGGPIPQRRNDVEHARDPDRGRYHHGDDQDGPEEPGAAHLTRNLVKWPTPRPTGSRR